LRHCGSERRKETQQADGGGGGSTEALAAVHGWMLNERTATCQPPLRGRKLLTGQGLSPCSNAPKSYDPAIPWKREFLLRVRAIPVSQPRRRCRGRAG